MYKGNYYSEIDSIKKRMKDLTYTPFEYLALRILILIAEINLDRAN